MGLNAGKFLTFDNSADLSNATVSSETVDVRDLRNFVLLLNLGGAPTGTLNVIHYYGQPTHLSTGQKSWATNENVVGQSFSPAAAVKYVHAVSSANGMPCSAVQVVYTRTSGTGTIKALLQSKGSGAS